MIGKKIPVSEAALRLHNDSIVLDCHSHFLINGYMRNRSFGERGKSPAIYNPLRNAIDLPKLQEGGVNALAFTSYTVGWPLFPRGTDRITDRILNRYYEIVGSLASQVAHCETAEEIRATVASGKLATFLAIEGAHVLEGKLENVQHFFERGVRLVTLTHFVANGIADGTSSPFRPHKGLSDFGRDVIKQMQSMGMMVDLAHCTEEAFDDAIAVSTRPLIFSHTGLRRFRDIERNISDDQVRELTRHGGLVGVIFFPAYLGKAGKDVRAIARTAYEIAKLSSPQHICLGSDMDAFTYTPRGFVDSSDMPQVTQALLDVGFDEGEVRGILGENFLRFFDESGPEEPSRE